MTAQSPLFEIVLGAEKVRFAPGSVEELSEWLNKESATWDALRAAPGPRGQDVSFLNGVNMALKVLARARETAAAARVHTGDEQKKFVSQTHTFLNQAFNEFRIPLSESVRSKLLAELATEDPFVAKVALYALGVGPADPVHLQIMSPALLRGIVEGNLLRRVSTDGVSDNAVRKLVEKGERTLAGWEAKHDRAVEQVNTTNTELEGSLNKFRADGDAAREKNKALVDELRSNYESELKAAKETLAKFRETISKDIALKAPTEYWRSKARSHRVNGFLLFLALIGLMLAFGIAADTWFLELVPQAAIDSKTMPSYGSIAVIVIVATLAFWILRIMVRLFFSQVHLAQDAQERVTMVTTYLALIETGKFQPGDLALVLNALFRNAADGIVKDEGMPPSLWEIVTRQSK